MEVALGEDQHPVCDFCSDRADESFGVTVGLWQRGGIFTTWMPASVETVSRNAENCPARSGIRNRNSAARSPRLAIRLRACCVVQPPSGLVVVPRMWT